MPAVAIIAQIVVSEVAGSMAAGTIGAAIAGSTALGSAAGVISTAVTGAIAGAAGGAAGAAVSGKNIWEGAGIGAISGGVGGGVAAGVGKGLAGSALSETAQKAISSGAGTAAGAAASGQDLGTALKMGGVTGLADYAIPTKSVQGEKLAKDATTGEKLASGAKTSVQKLTTAEPWEKTALKSGLSAALGVGQPQAARGGGGATVRQRDVRTTGQGEMAPGSAALGQALGVSGPGEPIFGATGEGKGKKPVWNVESLRYMGQPEEPSNA